MTNGRDEVLYKTDYLELLRRDGWYDFTREHDTVAFAVMIKGTKDTLVRYERIVCHNDEIKPTVFSGMIEKGMTPKETAIKELEEESGYTKGQISEIREYGIVRSSKSQDSTSHIFLIMVNNEEPNKQILGDGTQGEKDSYTKRMPLAQAIMEIDDPRFHTAILRTTGSNK